MHGKSNMETYISRSFLMHCLKNACEEAWMAGELDFNDLWCWRRLLRVPWTARRSNQSILKEISPGISLEGLMLKLKF